MNVQFVLADYGRAECSLNLLKAPHFSVPIEKINIHSRRENSKLNEAHYCLEFIRHKEYIHHLKLAKKNIILNKVSN